MSGGVRGKGDETEGKGVFYIIAAALKVPDKASSAATGRTDNLAIGEDPSLPTSLRLT